MFPNYKKYEFYKSSRSLVKEVYEITSKFPKDEQGFTGIVNQLRRASISVTSNIAEGSSRKEKEFYHFLSLSLGSLREIENQINISYDLGYISKEKYEFISEIIDKSISKLCCFMKIVGKNTYKK